MYVRLCPQIDSQPGMVCLAALGASLPELAVALHVLKSSSDRLRPNDGLGGTPLLLLLLL
jgi:Ca2+/Na+ antiporter